MSAQATFYIPGPDDNPKSLLGRWSDDYISLPAAIAVPHNRTDIIALISFAKQQNLKVVIAAGKHLASVPITSKTLYVDLKNFASIRIDETTHTVSVGGGAATGAVLNFLTEAGYYTSVPNTNTVGFVGAFLGGGSSTTNSITGFMIDNTVGIHFITAAGETLTLGPDSLGEEAALWHVLRGAGHGLGVVTELTVRIYPISELHMDDNKVWLRTMVFPPSALRIAASTFAALQPVRGPIGLNLIIGRSLPDTPMPNSPVIVLTAAYFGPSAEAERALAALLDPKVAGAAVIVRTSFLPMSGVNDGTKQIEVRGGFKRSEATILRNRVDAITIERSFDRFLQLGTDAPDTMRTSIVFYAFDSSVLWANGNSEVSRRDFFEDRDTRGIVYHDVWFREQPSATVVDAYLPEAIAIVRRGETGPMRRFANFVQHPANLNETYSEAKIVEKRRLKHMWDCENIFWTPGL